MERLAGLTYSRAFSTGTLHLAGRQRGGIVRSVALSKIINVDEINSHLQITHCPTSPSVFPNSPHSHLGKPR